MEIRILGPMLLLSSACHRGCLVESRWKFQSSTLRLIVSLTYIMKYLSSSPSTLYIVYE